MNPVRNCENKVIDYVKKNSSERKFLTSIAKGASKSVKTCGGKRYGAELQQRRAV